jgi:hypothetical protein
MPENVYQAKLIKRLRDLFPGCLILKNDTSYMQGVPDLIVLFNDRWGMLEVKLNARAKVQPNQAYYVSELNAMSFAAFIFPENEDEVLANLADALLARRPRRSSR